MSIRAGWYMAMIPLSQYIFSSLKFVCVFLKKKNPLTTTSLQNTLKIPLPRRRKKKFKKKCYNRPGVFKISGFEMYLSGPETKTAPPLFTLKTD